MRYEKDRKGLNLPGRSGWDVVIQEKIFPTLEGQYCLADKIAYINHDIEDAIRCIISEEDLPKE